MDTLSEAGGVSLEQQSSTPYLRQRQASMSSNTSGHVQYENAGLTEQRIDMDEPHSSHLAALDLLNRIVMSLLYPEACIVLYMTAFETRNSSRARV